MNTKLKSIEYLEKLIKRLEDIEQMESSLSKMQAKLELRELFAECYEEGAKDKEKESAWKLNNA